MGVPELSPIEERVVVLVAGGRTSEAIAAELGVGTRTVEWHLARARSKLARVAALHEHVRAAAGTAAEGGTR